MPRRAPGLPGASGSSIYRGNPAFAVTLAQALIDQGYRILAGAVSSDVALRLARLAAERRPLFVSGPAAADALTGLNRYTFRSGRQVYQDWLTAKSFLPPMEGTRILVFAPDTAYGQVNAGVVRSVFVPEDATVDRLLVPADTKDFGPFARRALEERPDLLFLVWAGTAIEALLETLDRQGVLAWLTVVTGLDQRAVYPKLGPVADRLSLFAHYLYQAPGNEVNRWLVERVRQRDDSAPDLFVPDGFVAAQMLVHALDVAGGVEVDTLIGALAGYSFTGPKGDYTIRQEDHALLQPMFQVELVRRGDGYEAALVETLAPDRVAPPINRFP